MPRWWSQRFAPEGSAAADGIKKQLGQPTLDPLTVLVREAAQNSWDARAGEEVRFNIDIAQLGTRSDIWKSYLESNLPTASGLFTSTEWTAETLVMTVSDRGTVGLGGPARADVRIADGVRPDFVQFLRNVGEPRNQALGGGTYGFGKGIYYTISRPGAILVDTNAVDRKAGRRLMGAALTNTWMDAQKIYTGRHWWGEVVGDIPDPVTGERASVLSAKLGLPGFGENDHGTDVVIIDPNLGMFDANRSRTIEEAIAFLRSSMVWHLWPKTISSGAGVLKLSTSLNGLATDLCPATEEPSIAPFADALEKARLAEGEIYQRKREPFNVGTVAVQLCEPELTADEKLNSARPISGARRHIARMRQVELIVDYFVGEPHSDSRFGYSGVFLGSEEADEVFGRAEPPTHDAWIASGLRGTDLGVIRGLDTFLRNYIQREVNPRRASKASSETAGLGRLAARLGSVTRGFSGTGAGSDGTVTIGKSGGVGGSGSGGSARRRLAKPRFLDGPVMVVDNSSALLRALVEVPSSNERPPIVATAQVILEGGRTEDEPPEGTTPPKFEWKNDESGVVVEGSTLPLSAGEVERWWLSLEVIDDVAVRVSVDWESSHD